MDLLTRRKLNKHDLMKRYNRHLKKTNGFEKYRVAWSKELEEKMTRDVFDYDRRLRDTLTNSRSLYQTIKAKFEELTEGEHIPIIGEMSKVRDHKEFIEPGTLRFSPPKKANIENVNDIDERVAQSETVGKKS